MGQYTRDQFVLITIEGTDMKDLLGYVVQADYPMAACYEVVLLRDHKKDSADDPIRAVGEASLKVATLEEIERQTKEWEAENHYKLPFTVARTFGGFSLVRLNPR